MLLFTNPMNIKHIEKDFDKNLMPYMWKGDNRKFVWKLCITFHIIVGIYLYGFEFVSYFLHILNVPLPYALYRSSFLFVLLRSRAIVLKTKFDKWNWKQNWKWHWKQNSNEFENDIENKIQTKLKATLKTKFKQNWKNQTKLKIKFKRNWKKFKWNSSNKIQTKFKI
jgi:hypothetical protein